jgi:hypothetical protein
MNNINLPSGFSVSYPGQSSRMSEVPMNPSMVGPRNCCEHAHGRVMMGSDSSALVTVIHALIDFVYKLLTKNPAQTNLSSRGVEGASSSVQSQPQVDTTPVSNKGSRDNAYSMDWWGTVSDIFSNLVVGLGGLRSLPGKVLRTLKKIF